MPQLDKLTYATQIFWLLILFTTFYFYTLKNILPTILGNISARETALNSAIKQIKQTEILIENKKKEFLNLMASYHNNVNSKIGVVTDKMKSRSNILLNTYNNLSNVISVSKNYDENLVKIFSNKLKS